VEQAQPSKIVIGSDQLILITGAAGFIGSRLVDTLLGMGFVNLRCLVRSSPKSAPLRALAQRHSGANLEVMEGNLLSREDCRDAVREAAVVFHLAAGRGEKSVPEAFLNSVVTTRNLIEAGLKHDCLKRLVNVSSFAVYANVNKARWRLLDETCATEVHPELRGDAYTFAKVKQDEIVAEYGRNHGLPYVIVRPGYVYGPGKAAITGRVGIGTFGVFLHMGGSNRIPFTYVDNCAQAIALAGLVEGIEGEVFNVVDDDLPSSRRFLYLYKKNVKKFRSIYVPHCMSYFLCSLWERYSAWSEGQLPPVFNRRMWHCYWKKTQYSNEKLRSRLGWRQKVPTAEGLTRYFESCRNEAAHA
jgi:nucleoside-diphosphate-sugar epimerase